MAMKMKKLLLVLGFALGLATSLNAFNARDIYDSRSSPVTQGWLNGVAQALNFANELNSHNGHPKLFCLGMNITFTEDLAAQALRTGLDVHGDEWSPAFLVILGLQEMFPCK